LDWLHTRGAERLGICRGIRCADAFADLSPSGRKIFCSNGCLNRHKVAEHRRRAKTALSAPTGEREDPVARGDQILPLEARCELEVRCERCSALFSLARPGSLRPACAPRPCPGP